jgi:hypothetical protein
MAGVSLLLTVAPPKVSIWHVVLAVCCLAGCLICSLVALLAARPAGVFACLLSTFSSDA